MPTLKQSVGMSFTEFAGNQQADCRAVQEFQ